MEGYFDNYNAKYLNSFEVARGFVPPREKFRPIFEQGNSLLIGPRGSGKTTLLKMATLDALALWEDEASCQILEGIPFLGVHVPSDREWSEKLQFDHLRDLGADVSNDVADDLANYAFSWNAIGCLIETLWRASDCRDMIKEKSGGRLCVPDFISDPSHNETLALIANCLKLSPKFSGLFGLQIAVEDLLDELWCDSLDVRAMPASERAAALAVVSRKYKIDLARRLQLVMSALGSLAVLPAGFKAALLFDELEIIPDFIRDGVFRKLRGRGGPVYYKLSIAPCDASLHTLLTSIDTKSPSLQGDYEPIRLWYPGKDDGVGFLTDLWNKKCRDICGGRRIPAEKFFGESILEGGSSNKDNYKPGSRKRKVIERLYWKDASFRDFFLRNGVSPDQIGSLSENEMARFVRKPFQVIELRDHYIKESEMEGDLDTFKPTIRGRNVFSDCYAGYPTLFTLCEGNPRTFLGVLRGLGVNKSDGQNRVRKGRQMSAIRIAIERFESVVKTYPVIEYSEDHTKAYNLLDILKALGEYIEDGIISGPFSADPTGTFLVPDNVTDELDKGLIAGVKAGALIWCHENEKITVLHSLAGQRIRLSYVLAPKYKMPLRMDKYRNLGNVLEEMLGKDTYKYISAPDFGMQQSLDLGGE